MRVLREACDSDRLLREVVLIATASRRVLGAVLCVVVACLCASTGASQAAQGASAIIFMYHHVAPTVLPGPYARDLTVTPAEFSSHLSWLHEHGCRVTSVDALVGDVHSGRVTTCEAALTFDDGYDDVATYALPLLRKSGVRATFYITTGYVGQSGHLSLRQLQTLHAAGMEIGAHTVHHLDLTTLDAAQAREEVEASATTLRRWLNAPITAFAYPAGSYNAAVIRDVATAGLATAVTTEPGEVTIKADRYALPRYRIERGTGLALMRAVFADATQARGSATVPTTLQHIARARIAGNAPKVAEEVAVAILARSFPEQVLKVHVLALPSSTVAGIVLSGVKFHAPVDRRQFASDVRTMVDLALAAAPSLDEVDIWATVPQPVQAGAQVSGDYAVPTSRTVFSCAVPRAQAQVAGTPGLGVTYWDSDFLRAGAASANGERL